MNDFDIKYYYIYLQGVQLGEYVDANELNNLTTLFNGKLVKKQIEGEIYYRVNFDGSFTLIGSSAKDEIKARENTTAGILVKIFQNSIEQYAGIMDYASCLYDYDKNSIEFKTITYDRYYFLLQNENKNYNIYDIERNYRIETELKYSGKLVFSTSPFTDGVGSLYMTFTEQLSANVISLYAREEMNIVEPYTLSMYVGIEGWTYKDDTTVIRDWTYYFDSTIATSALLQIPAMQKSLLIDLLPPANTINYQVPDNMDLNYIQPYTYGLLNYTIIYREDYIIFPSTYLTLLDNRLIYPANIVNYTRFKDFRDVFTDLIYKSSLNTINVGINTFAYFDSIDYFKNLFIGAMGDVILGTYNTEKTFLQSITKLTFKQLMEWLKGYDIYYSISDTNEILLLNYADTFKTNPASSQNNLVTYKSIGLTTNKNIYNLLNDNLSRFIKRQGTIGFYQDFLGIDIEYDTLQNKEVKAIDLEGIYTDISDTLINKSKYPTGESSFMLITADEVETTNCIPYLLNGNSYNYGTEGYLYQFYKLDGNTNVKYKAKNNIGKFDFTVYPYKWGSEDTSIILGKIGKVFAGETISIGWTMSFNYLLFYTYIASSYDDITRSWNTLKVNMPADHVQGANSMTYTATSNIDEAYFILLAIPHTSAAAADSLYITISNLIVLAGTKYRIRENSSVINSITNIPNVELSIAWKDEYRFGKALNFEYVKNGTVYQDGNNFLEKIYLQENLWTVGTSFISAIDENSLIETELTADAELIECSQDIMKKTPIDIKLKFATLK